MEAEMIYCLYNDVLMEFAGCLGTVVKRVCIRVCVCTRAHTCVIPWVHFADVAVRVHQEKRGDGLLYR